MLATSKEANWRKTLDTIFKTTCISQEQLQQHQAVSAALADAEQEAQWLSSVKQQAEATQEELTALKSTHEALLSELAVTGGRLAGFDESCRHSLDRVQHLSAALQEAQQAKVAFLIVLHLCDCSSHDCGFFHPLQLVLNQRVPCRQHSFHLSVCPWSRHACINQSWLEQTLAFWNALHVAFLGFCPDT